MIFLNDILGLDTLSNVKIRFNQNVGESRSPIQLFKSGEMNALIAGQYWNGKQKNYSGVRYTIGLIQIHSDLWLLFHIGEITKDLNRNNDVGYEFKNVKEYNKYVGRVIVRYKKTSQLNVRWADPLIGECEVSEILSDTFDNDLFPGYENVNISWSELKVVISKEGWRSALKNQKGVYLITDTSNGKMYVGSAYGENMLLGRWASYVATRNGGNKELRKIQKDHIEKHFRYSILDIYKSTVSDEQILNRESWWKRVLLTRDFGYNAN